MIKAVDRSSNAKIRLCIERAVNFVSIHSMTSEYFGTCKTAAKPQIALSYVKMSYFLKRVHLLEEWARCSGKVVYNA